MVLAPSFAPTLRELRAALPSPRDVRVSARSSLVVRGASVEIAALELDGALELDASAPGAAIVARRHAVQSRF